MNRLATILNVTHEIITGNAIFVANKQPIEDYSIGHQDVSLQDIFNIFVKRVKHQGWILTPNKNKIPFYFDNQKKILDRPEYQEMWDSASDSNYQAEEFPFLDHKLMLFRKKKSTYTSDDKFNLLATRLYGKERVRGNMIIISMISESLADDLTEREIDMLLQAALGRLSDRVIPPEKQEEERDEVGRVMVKNKYRHLYQHNISQKILCNLCHSPDTPYCCGSCGRIKYCSALCQKKDWTYHKHKCLI